jgi:hypothetical protein
MEMQKLTIAIVKTRLAALGITMRKTADGEYKVNYRNSSEASAYYASDLADALSTGEHMANSKR